jgi:PiT family inorganic phosphate transporter
VTEVFTSLLVSPIIGFTLAALLLLVAKATLKRPELYEAPEPGQAPPTWVRGLLILTCTGVSFAHGSNDGQKGMGLLMLILVGIVPATFALNLNTDAQSLNKLLATAQTVSISLDKHSTGQTLTPEQAKDELSSFLKTTGKQTTATFPALAAMNHDITTRLTGKSDLNMLSRAERSTLRSDIYLASETIGKLDKKHQFTDATEDKAVMDYKQSLDKLTKFIPDWVKVMVALALGLGTMIGWKRIVVTVGEKIGKEHLTYAQGASAELVAMGTIMAADHFNLPVSTTHVLSSGVAGTMAANHSGLQMGTLRNLLLAWVLTLPVCVLLGAGTFSAGFYVVFHILGLK